MWAYVLRSLVKSGNILGQPKVDILSIRRIVGNLFSEIELYKLWQLFYVPLYTGPKFKCRNGNGEEKR